MQKYFCSTLVVILFFLGGCLPSEIQPTGGLPNAGVTQDPIKDYAAGKQHSLVSYHDGLIEKQISFAGYTVRYRPKSLQELLQEDENSYVVDSYAFLSGGGFKDELEIRCYPSLTGGKISYFVYTEWAGYARKCTVKNAAAETIALMTFRQDFKQAEKGLIFRHAGSAQVGISSYSLAPAAEKYFEDNPTIEQAVVIKQNQETSALIIGKGQFSDLYWPKSIALIDRDKLAILTAIILTQTNQK